MKKSVLKNYARLIAQMGVNIQPGEEVKIQCDLDQPEFIKMLTEECYKLGAKKVVVDWMYQPLDKIHVNYRDLDTLKKVEKWEKEKMKRETEVFPARIYVMSEDPDGLKGIDREKWAKMCQARYKVMKPYIDKLEGTQKWCIAAVPGKKWAKKVFPELRVQQAMEKLWDNILYTSRAAEGEDPVKNWQEHNKDLHARCDYLNSLKIKKLIYKSSNGTDFEVGLIPDSRFSAASEKTLQGQEYNPNIPSEECFISPMKGEAEGIVYSSKPLAYRGELIEDFWIKFENGKAVDCQARVNGDLLKQLISMDEGSCYLGECALVPYDSPIRESGILFYNTLFDENAACHLALGRGFIETIKDYDKYTLEEIRKMGVNDSMVHEDFMIGTKDLNITAICENGKKVPIFKNGNWAF